MMLFTTFPFYLLKLETTSKANLPILLKMEPSGFEPLPPSMP